MSILFGSMMNFGDGYSRGMYMDQGYLGVFGFMWLVTWVLVIAGLVAFVRWMWKQGDKVK